MRERIRSHLTVPTVISLAALFVALGSTATAVTYVVSSNSQIGPGTVAGHKPPTGKHSNLITGSVNGLDVADNSITGADVANVGSGDITDNSLGSADIKDGEISVADTNKVIPSGATVTGAFRGLEDEGGTGDVTLRVSEDFYGLRAPTALTNADVSFDDTGISAAAAASSDESSGCTGGIGIPTAPPGKVCIYLYLENVTDGSATAHALGDGTPFTQADDKGFFIDARGPAPATLGGTWAYTAP